MQGTNRLMHRWFMPIGMTLVVFLLQEPARAIGAVFTPLGDLAGGAFSSSGNGISANGQVVVGHSFTSSGREAFRWTEETGMVSLGAPNTSAEAANFDGTVIVGFHKNGAEAMRWTAETGIVGLGHLTPESISSQAQAVSADGSVIVGYNAYAIGHLEPFRWTEETGMVGMGYLPGGGGEGSANGISLDGTVIAGGTFVGGGQLAFRWTAETGMVSLGELPGGRIDSVAYGMSANGLFIVGGSQSGTGPLISEPFRWSAESGMVGLGGLRDDTSGSAAHAVSADGSVIVGAAASTSSGQEAFIWNEISGVRSLQEVLANEYGLSEVLNGWKLERAHSITPDGLTIVGSGRNPAGQQEGWRVQLVVPEPHTAAMSLFAYATMIFTRRRTS
jgi:probable HAF family extracellular repeat protein